MSNMNKRQGLEALHHQCLKLLHSFAVTTQDAARYTDYTPSTSQRIAELTRAIKRDLEEFKVQLDGIRDRHQREITPNVRSNLNHPQLLKAGGDYYGFIESVTDTVTPHSGELMDLIGAHARAKREALDVQESQ